MYKNSMLLKIVNETKYTLHCINCYLADDWLLLVFWQEKMATSKSANTYNRQGWEEAVS